MLLPILLALGMQAPDTAHLVIVSTTDVHGHATEWNYLTDAPYPGGLARVATVVDSLRRQYPGQVILVDAGDIIEGEPFATYFAREAPRDPHPIFDVMSAMGYDAATPGNHDFDYGVPFLFRVLHSAGFPFVSGNIYTLPVDTLALPGFIVVQRGGVRVGITGFTTPGVMLWDRDNLAQRNRVARIGAVAPRILQRLVAGSDFSIVLAHTGLDGASSYDTTGIGPENVAASLAALSDKPNLVVLGHTHHELADSVIAGVHFVQPRPGAQSVSVVHVTLERNGETWRVRRMRGELVQLGRVTPSVAITRRLATAHEAVRHWATAPLASASTAMPALTGRAEPTTIVNYLNDLQRRKAGTDLSATAIYDLNAGLPAGDFTLARVAALYPYENTLVGLRVTGTQLKAYLEHSARYFRVDGSGDVSLNDSIVGYNYDVVSGAEYAIDLRLPPGDRIRGLSVRGKPVEPGDQFTIALNSYRAAGGGGYGMLAGSPVVYNRGENIRELIVADLRARRMLRAEDFSTRNWTIVPEEAARAARRLFTPTAEPPRVSPPRDTILLRIFAITDLHGALEARVQEWSGGRPVGGLPVLKRLMDSLAAQCGCADLRLDSGDEMQGTLASNLEFGRSTVTALNRLGLGAAGLGNHDFDWSVDTLLRRMADARYPWLAANIVDSATGARPDWAVPYKVLQAGRLRVGVIGYITPETKDIVRGDLLAGLRFEGPASLVQPLQALRAERPDLVILLAHEGAMCEQGADGACSGPILDLARGLDSTSVDLILAGHSHRLVNTRVHGIPIVQAASSGGAVAVVDVIKTLVGSREMRTRLITPFADSIGSDTAMLRLIGQFKRGTDSLANRSVASLKVPMNREGDQYALGNLFADAQRNALRSDFALMNNGGIRSNLPAGPVTYSQVYEVAPLGNDLVRIRITGKDMRAVLEHVLEGGAPSAHIAGLRVSYDPSRPAGRRVREVLLLNGKRLEDRTTYTLAITDFLAGGKSGYGMLPALPREVSGISALDALINYLRRLPQPVAPPEDIRFMPGR
ncbi:MAG: 5'-nucleotidase C-terminal domain-containing protein [Gemmatimonadota bacterium]